MALLECSAFSKFVQFNSYLYDMSRLTSFLFASILLASEDF